MMSYNSFAQWAHIGSILRCLCRDSTCLHGHLTPNQHSPYKLDTQSPSTLQTWHPIKNLLTTSFKLCYYTHFSIILLMMWNWMNGVLAPNKGIQHRLYTLCSIIQLIALCGKGNIISKQGHRLLDKWLALKFN